MSSLANGGSADDIQPGIDFFKSLKSAGNFLPTDPTAATIESGQTPLVIDWDYLNAGESAKLSTWKVVVPDNAVVGGYYYQAVSADAPAPGRGPAVAGVPLLRPGPEPVPRRRGTPRPGGRDERRPGTIDKTAFAKLPPVKGTPVILTADQTKKAAGVLSSEWAKATS